MNGHLRLNDQQTTAQLAALFNEFYLQLSLPVVSQIGSYRIIEEIGEGAFGKVYLAQHVLLNTQVVLKCGLVDDPNIVREIYYHKQLRHKNIVKLYEVVKTEKHLWLVLEYCEGNELFYLIYEKRRLEMDECRALFFQIVIALKHVHLLNVAHRDLKLENILLADKRRTVVKLTDFGFVREFNPHKRQFLLTVCGTTVYMAPELLKNEKYLGFAIDIWSLGVILYTMIYGEMPFDEDDDLKTKFKIIYDDPIYRDLGSPDAVLLVQKMLSKDPRNRPTLTEVLNLDFLIDLNNKALEKSRRTLLHNDAESIVSINQHYKVNLVPFQSKIEKHLLKKFHKLNINVEQLQQAVHNNETSSLTAFYDLLLAHEYNRKKKRYLKERKLRYYEARKTLKKLRNRVKSALSLTDQAGTQPLERIISSLSLSSNRNSSAALKPTPMRRSFDDLFLRKRTDLLLQLHLSEKPHTPTSSPPIQRIVSFYPENLSFRRPSDATTALSLVVSQNLKKRTKNTRLINRLQFWKRSRPEGDVNSAETRSSGVPFTPHSSTNTTAEDPKNRQGSEDSGRPLEIAVHQAENGDSRRSHSPNEPVLAQNGLRPSKSAPDSPRTVATQTEPHNPVTGLPIIADISKDEDITPSDPRRPLSEQESAHLNLPVIQTTPTLDNYYGLSSTRLRARPSSVISQVSQLSHLSQLLTMLSELELDILDETSMDDEYDEDEMVYESSINTLQYDFLQGRNLLTSMGPLLSNKQKKRPQYSRNLSSDMSIMLTSTTAGLSVRPPAAQPSNKKFSLSLLSSNSLDDSLNRNVNHDPPNRHLNMDHSHRNLPSEGLNRGFSNGALDPFLAGLARSNSPDAVRYAGTSNAIFVKPKLLAHPKLLALSRPARTELSAPQPVLAAQKLGPLKSGFGLKSLTGANSTEDGLVRSHSPPISKKFNTLKMNSKLIKPMKSVFELSLASDSEALVKEEPKSEEREEKTWVPKIPNSYEPKFIRINEEEEDEVF